MYFVGLALWLAFLVAAILYTRRVRHPNARPLAAYLIFVIVFTVSAFVMYAGLIILLQVSGHVDDLVDPIAAALFLAAVFIPAFFIARWQLRKPPKQP